MSKLENLTLAISATIPYIFLVWFFIELASAFFGGAK